MCDRCSRLMTTCVYVSLASTLNTAWLYSSSAMRQALSAATRCCFVPSTRSLPSPVNVQRDLQVCMFVTTLFLVCMSNVFCKYLRKLLTLSDIVDTSRIKSLLPQTKVQNKQINEVKTLCVCVCILNVLISHFISNKYDCISNKVSFKLSL